MYAIFEEVDFGGLQSNTLELGALSLSLEHLVPEDNDDDYTEFLILLLPLLLLVHEPNSRLVARISGWRVLLFFFSSWELELHFKFICSQSDE